MPKFVDAQAGADADIDIGFIVLGVICYSIFKHHHMNTNALFSLISFAATKYKSQDLPKDLNDFIKDTSKAKPYQPNSIKNNGDEDESLNVLKAYFNKGYYVHYSYDKNKFSININQDWDTPFGTCGYILDPTFITHKANFAKDRPYIHIFKPYGNGLFCGDYTQQNLDDDIEKIYDIFPSKTEQELSNIISQGIKSAYQKIPISQIFNITRIISNENPRTWSKLLISLGYDYVVDNKGQGIIHTGEPAQIIVLSNDISAPKMNLVATINNPKKLLSKENFGIVNTKFNYYQLETQLTELSYQLDVPDNILKFKQIILSILENTHQLFPVQMITLLGKIEHLNMYMKNQGIAEYEDESIRFLHLIENKIKTMKYAPTENYVCIFPSEPFFEDLFAETVYELAREAFMSDNNKISLECCIADMIKFGNLNYMEVSQNKEFTQMILNKMFDMVDKNVLNDKFAELKFAFVGYPMLDVIRYNLIKYAIESNINAVNYIDEQLDKFIIQHVLNVTLDDVVERFVKRLYYTNKSSWGFIYSIISNSNVANRLKILNDKRKTNDDYDDDDGDISQSFIDLLIKINKMSNDQFIKNFPQLLSELKAERDSFSHVKNDFTPIITSKYKTLNYNEKTLFMSKYQDFLYNDSSYKKLLTALHYST